MNCSNIILQFVVFHLLITVGAVDVLIFNKSNYSDNTPFILNNFKRNAMGYDGYLGTAYVAVEVTIVQTENPFSLIIEWTDANTLVEPAKTEGIAAPEPKEGKVGTETNRKGQVGKDDKNQIKLPQCALDFRKLHNLTVESPEKAKPLANSNSRFFVLAMNPDIDGGRRFIELPHDVAEMKIDDRTRITFNLNSEQLNIVTEANANFEKPSQALENIRFEIGEEICGGNIGKLFSISVKEGPLSGKPLVMKRCKANQPGTVVPIEEWAERDYYETINRNDYRIGRLLNPYKEKSRTRSTRQCVPMYYAEGVLSQPRLQEYDYYFIMERIEGGSIETELLKAQSTGDKATLSKIYKAMLQVVILVHEKGIVHGDLHSGNFLKSTNLDTNDAYVVILIDLGLSRIAVEWENHIKEERPIFCSGIAPLRSVRAEYGLGTDFHSDMEMLVFVWLNGYTNTHFFGEDRLQFAARKRDVLLSNWNEWPHLETELKRYKIHRFFVVSNLNDLLFILPSLVYCRETPGDYDQLGETLRNANADLFPKTKNKKDTNTPATPEVGHSGYLLKQVLPEVKARYMWPKYKEFEAGLTRIADSKCGTRHPSTNPTNSVPPIPECPNTQDVYVPSQL